MIYTNMALVFAQAEQEKKLQIEKIKQEIEKLKSEIKAEELAAVESKKN